MKKLTYIIILLTTIVSCGGNSSETSLTYTDPGFNSVENVKGTKEAIFANMPGQNSSGPSCNAIIFQKNIDGKDYVAIGYKKNSFYLKFIGKTAPSPPLWILRTLISISMVQPVLQIPSSSQCNPKVTAHISLHLPAILQWGHTQ